VGKEVKKVAKGLNKGIWTGFWRDTKNLEV
jgi:hypothetical protein